MKPALALLASTIAGGFVVSEELLAAEWQRDLGLTLGAFVSDNICLSDEDKKTRGAGIVTPDLYIRGRGTHTNLVLAAALEYNTLGDSNIRCTSGQIAERSNRESIVPSLRYIGDLEVINDWLTLETDAFAGRNPADPFAPGDRDNLNGRDNVNITYQYGAGAVLQRRLSDTLAVLARFHRSEQYNKLNLLGDSSENRWQFALGTEPGSSRIALGIAGRYSKVMNDGSVRNAPFDNTLSSAEALTSLQLNTNLQLNALVGEEWNEFITARHELDGSRWDAGLRWTPNDRITVEIGTGERFFGSTPRMSISYEHKRSQLTVSYATNLNFPRDLRTADVDFRDPLDPGLGGGNEGFGELPGDPLQLRGEPTFIGNSPIINERLSIRYRLSGRWVTMTLSANKSKQTRTEDSGVARFSNLATSFSRLLSARLSANLRFGWRESEGQDGNVGVFGRQSETWFAGMGLSSRLGRDTTLSLAYQFTHRDSEVASNRYHENRLILSANHQFR